MSLVDLFYPPICIHCRHLLDRQKKLCALCTENLSLIAPLGHCSKCYMAIPYPEGTCKPCRLIRHPFNKLAASFDSFGPAKSLLNSCIHLDRPDLAKDLAAFLFLQIEQCKFPTFDTLTMLPNYFRNPQYLIAKELAKLMQIPFRPVLRRTHRNRWGYTLKKGCEIINHSVLLIGEGMISRNRMRNAGWALHTGTIKRLYGISICATLYS